MCATICLALLLGATMGAQAQSVAGGISESTDPAKVAAAERAAHDLKARQEREARAGKVPPSFTVVRGRTDEGLTYMSGGVSGGDQSLMYAERSRYSLWVATVARPSGAWLADAQVRITHLGTRRVVLERQMDGPWLFVALPAGRYEVAATLQPDGAERPQTVSTRVGIGDRGQREAVLRFDSSADVEPESTLRVFKGSPFGEPVAPR